MKLINFKLLLLLSFCVLIIIFFSLYFICDENKLLITATFIITVITTIIVLGYLSFQKNDDSIEQDFDIIIKEVDALKSDRQTLIEYHRFLSDYYNEDWNRNNPFEDKIDSTNLFFKHNRILPLSVKIKDLKLTEIELEILKENFQDMFLNIRNMRLDSFLYFIAELKTYKENDQEVNYIDAETFYNERIKQYF